MLDFMITINTLLLRNGEKGDVKSFEATTTSYGTKITNVEMTDGRNIKFSRSGRIKKEKLPTRKERRAAKVQ